MRAPRFISADATPSWSVGAPGKESVASPWQPSRQMSAQVSTFPATAVLSLKLMTLKYARYFDPGESPSVFEWTDRITNAGRSISVSGLVESLEHATANTAPKTTANPNRTCLVITIYLGQRVRASGAPRSLASRRAARTIRSASAASPNPRSSTGEVPSLTCL